MNNNKNIYIEHIVNNLNRNWKKKNKCIISKTNVRRFKIACILDRFSYECLKYEADFYQLGYYNWKEVIDKSNPDLLFIESAWEGHGYQWINRIANMEKYRDDTLIKITDYCRKKDIPTVFWAKEDPTDFHVFSEAAKYFEYVFTTDINCISKHKEILGHNNVFLLPLAAQPQLHNPIDRDKEKIGKVAFAGSWYEKFENRKIYIHNLLRPAKKHGLVIYNRFFYSNNDQFAFPDEYKAYIRKGLDYKSIVSEYKKYNIFLNVNSDNTSPTAFSRRVYELLACGVPVISSYNPGIINFFKDIVFISNSEEDTEKYIARLLNDKELRDRISLLGQREVFNNHTYEQRFKGLLNTLGLEKSEEVQEGVSVITYASSAVVLDNILENYICQNYSPKELILIVESDLINLIKKNPFIRKCNNVILLKFPNRYSIGKVFNLAVKNSKYNYISIFDENSYYAPNYLVDIINTLKYTNANITGKNTIYKYLTNTKDVILNDPKQEYKFTKYISNSTFTFKKDIYTKIKFQDNSNDPYGSFLKDCIKNGLKIYSSDRFNHVFIEVKCNEKIDRKLIEKKFNSLII